MAGRRRFACIDSSVLRETRTPRALDGRHDRASCPGNNATALDQRHRLSATVTTANMPLILFKDTLQLHACSYKGMLEFSGTQQKPSRSPAISARHHKILSNNVYNITTVSIRGSTICIIDFSGINLLRVNDTR